MSQKLVVIARLKDGRVLRGTYPAPEALARKFCWQDDPACESIQTYEPGTEPIVVGKAQPQGPAGQKQPTGEPKSGGVAPGHQPGAAPFTFGLRSWEGL